MVSFSSVNAALVVQSACFYLDLFGFESVSMINGYEGHFAVCIPGAILTFFAVFNISWLCMDRFLWTGFDENGDQIEDFLML